MLSTTTPLRDGRRETGQIMVGHNLRRCHPGADPPRGEAGVVGVAQQLVGVADGHQPVSDQLEAQALVVGRLVHCKENADVVRCGPAASADLWGSLRTRHGVVHVEAVALDVFQGHAPVDKHPGTEEKGSETGCAPHPAAEVELGGGHRCYQRCTAGCVHGSPPLLRPALALFTSLHSSSNGMNKSVEHRSSRCHRKRQNRPKETTKRCIYYYFA